MAVCLLFLSSRALAQDEEVDAIPRRRTAEALAAAMAEGFAAEAEAVTAVDLGPALGGLPPSGRTKRSPTRPRLLDPSPTLRRIPFSGDGEFVLRKTHLHVPGSSGFVRGRADLPQPREPPVERRVRLVAEPRGHIEDVLPSGGHGPAKATLVLRHRGDGANHVRVRRLHAHRNGVTPTRRRPPTFRSPVLVKKHQGREPLT